MTAGERRMRRAELVHFEYVCSERRAKDQNWAYHQCGGACPSLSWSSLARTRSSPRKPANVSTRSIRWSGVSPKKPCRTLVGTLVHETTSSQHFSAKTSQRPTRVPRLPRFLRLLVHGRWPAPHASRRGRHRALSVGSRTCPRRRPASRSVGNDMKSTVHLSSLKGQCRIPDEMFCSARQANLCLRHARYASQRRRMHRSPRGAGGESGWFYCMTQAPAGWEEVSTGS